MLNKLLLLVILSALMGSSGITPPADDYVLVQGRAEYIQSNNIMLIGSGSSVTLSFNRNRCTVYLKAVNENALHDYVVLEIDGKYAGRKRVEAMGGPVSIGANGNGPHILTVYKATEAANGAIQFLGAETAFARLTTRTPKKKIEFIGASVTCGMGADTSAIPCGEGLWYDQHNAYLAYGPVASRALGTDFLLSSVSGIGVYRNWNDEGDGTAAMPDVYEKLHMHKDSTKYYGFTFKPDITCIALGGNDMAGGDGKEERLPFNEEKFTARYTALLNTVYGYYPDTQVVLLNSPMMNEKDNAKLVKCLQKVQQHFAGREGRLPVEIFSFSKITPKGCSYHPDVDDHKKMAAELKPFLDNLLHKKK